MVPIPPPLLAAAAGLAQRLVTPHAGPTSKPRALTAGVVTLASMSMAGGATSRFRRGGTTVDPIHPDRASTLVTTGPNALTRNPMYVGLAGVLVANAVRRGSWLALLPAAGFVVWIDRLQIAPEEAALRGIFGEEYEDYCAAVPRWLDRRSLEALRR